MKMVIGGAYQGKQTMQNRYIQTLCGVTGHPAT